MAGAAGERRADAGAVVNTSSPASLLSTAQAAARCGLSPRTLEKLRITGGGPPYAKLSRSVRYDLADLDAWIASNRRASTSDTRAGTA